MIYVVVAGLALLLALFIVAARRSGRSVDWVRKVQDIDPLARHWIMAAIRERQWLADKIGHESPLLTEIDSTLEAMIPVSVAWRESEATLKRLEGSPSVSSEHVRAVRAAEAEQRQVLERAVERIRTHVHEAVTVATKGTRSSLDYEALHAIVDELKAAQDAREELRQTLGE